VQREVELRRGELGHGLDEDVGDDLVLDPVGVELVELEQRPVGVAVAELLLTLLLQVGLEDLGGLGL